MENSKLVQTSNDRGSKVSLDVRCEVKEVRCNMAKKMNVLKNVCFK